MISGKTIVCFASGWDFHPTSKHHIMRKLSEQNNIVWINWHASRRPKVDLADLLSIGSKIRQIRRGPRRVSDNITVLTPFQIPFPKSASACRLTAIMVRRAVQKMLKHLPPRPVQLWSFAPDVARLVGQFDEELALYYCVDAFGEFPGYNRELIERRERELLAKCDLVITTSTSLKEAKNQWHPNVHFVQHGVEHEHLSRAVREDMLLPREFRGLSRPIFGFVGLVAEWVDLELVAGLAKLRPEASIVMIGPRSTPLGPCANMPNVHFFGGKDHAVLPNYLRFFDVGLIPFKRVPLTHNSNPIKLYEYLVAGVPVVSTSLPAVERIPGSVWLADDAAATATCCDQALKYNDQAAREHRSNMMIAESWTARLEQVSEIIATTLKQRPRTSRIETINTHVSLSTAQST